MLLIIQGHMPSWGALLIVLSGVAMLISLPILIKLVSKHLHHQSARFTTVSNGLLRGYLLCTVWISAYFYGAFITLLGISLILAGGSVLLRK